MRNNQKGITLVGLIITIIVTMILASVTVQIGTGSIENSRVLKFVSYMQTLQAKVDLISQKEDYLNYGEELSSSIESKLQTILNDENLLTTTSSTYLRYFDSDHIASDLQIDNVEDEVIVDFNTREVISLTGIQYEDKMYYTQYNLPGGQVLKQKTEDVDRTISLGTIKTNIDGLNANFTIKNIGLTNGTLSYGRKDLNGEIIWTEITNYTIKGNDITTKNITESDTYYFKLQDNTTGIDNVDGNGNYPSVDLKLTNMPKLEGDLTDLTTTYNYSDINDSSKWAYATSKTDAANVKYYIWIPRFAYKIDSNGVVVKDDDGKVSLEFLRGTSEITTSGGYINSTEWRVPDIFTDGLKTGVWIKVDTPNKARCRYN